jgi:AcrR family transcriptional regulator
MEKENTIRERIVGSARERFLTMGFSKVTMDELVSELGISKKTMYQHFRSKDKLLDEVIEWQIITVTGHIQEVMKSSADFIDRMYNMWATMGKWSCQIRKQFLEDLRKFRPDLWTRIHDHRQKFLLGHVSQMIDEGIRLGFVRSDVNKEIMALMYLGAVQSIVNPEVISQHSFSTEEAYKTVLQLYLDAILTDNARKHFHKRISNQ